MWGQVAPLPESSEVTKVASDYHGVSAGLLPMGLGRQDGLVASRAGVK